jgi:DNA-binding CsgD family transcriptional regulator
MLQLSKQMVAVSDDNGTGRLFADGKNSAEIARTLGISLQTLRNHLHHINEKLGTHRRLHTVMHAMRRKL